MIVTAAPQANCARANELELFLYNEGLMHIPVSVFRAVQLRRLHLGANQISSVPESILHLVHLEQLGLGKNLFTDFPEAVCHLPALQDLILYENQARANPWAPAAARVRLMVQGRGTQAAGTADASPALHASSPTSRRRSGTSGRCAACSCIAT
jgi:hypothetical protein